MASRHPSPFFKSFFIEIKKDFSKGKLNGWLRVMFLLLIGISAISYVLYGPYYSPDTVNYFHFSRNFSLHASWTNIYSPFYPFLLFCFSLLPFISLFQAAHLIILIQYFTTLYFLVQLAKGLSGYYSFNLKDQLTLSLMMLITFHTWWSFRIISWAHADATFYTFLIIWSYFMIQYMLKGSPGYLVIFSLLSATLVWVKLNAVALIVFFMATIIFGIYKKKWMVPFITVSMAYALYQFIFPGNILSTYSLEIPYSNYFSLRGLGIFYSNLGEFFKVSWGFFLSDTITGYLPSFLGFSGGMLLLAFLVYLAVLEIKKGVTPAAYFLLFGLVYLLCLLGFQQIIFFQEINYRSIFPFFLGCSWFLWIKLLNLGKNSTIFIFLLAFLMTSHTLLGHLLLWKRQDVNSLFEVGRLMESEMTEKIQSLQRNAPIKKNLLLTDFPEKLSLLLNDPKVVHYDPAFQFLKGKRRLIPVTEKQRKFDLNKEKLLNGDAVIILFEEDPRLIDFAVDKGLCLFEYPEGLIISAPKNADTLNFQE